MSTSDDCFLLLADAVIQLASSERVLWRRPRQFATENDVFQIRGQRLTIRTFLSQVKEFTRLVGLLSLVSEDRMEH